MVITESTNDERVKIPLHLFVKRDNMRIYRHMNVISLTVITYTGNASVLQKSSIVIYVSYRACIPFNINNLCCKSVFMQNAVSVIVSYLYIMHKVYIFFKYGNTKATYLHRFYFIYSFI